MSTIIYFILVLVLSQTASVMAVGETVVDNIGHVQPDAACLSRQARPCRRSNGTIIANYPPAPYPCPCAVGSNGGAFPGDGPVTRAADPGFVDVLLVPASADNFTNLISMSFTDNTRELFVITKPGFVYRVDLVTGQRNVWLELVDEVHNAGDKGLISIETHPNFRDNPYVYLSFVVDPIFGQPDELSGAPTHLRVIRVTDNNGIGVPNSRVTLLGKDDQSAYPICSTTHAGGGLAFGNDGTLFLTTGDGAHFDYVDFGQITSPQDTVCENRFGKNIMYGAFRAQSLDNLAGKLLRLDPPTGNGICSGKTILNPYCNGDPTSIRSRIYAIGFRNPFSIGVKPGPNTFPGIPYVGDVGFGSFEELNAVTQPGMNFGWPCWEGPLPQAGYRDSAYNTANGVTFPRINNTRLNCPYVYNNVLTTTPFFYYSRYTQRTGTFNENYWLGQGFQGNCVAGVSFYKDGNYPESYDDTVWLLDFGQRWIRVIRKTNENQYVSIQNMIQSDTPILSLKRDPYTGNICYLKQSENEVRMFRYVGTGPTANTAPQAAMTYNVTSGTAPLAVRFSMDGTRDPDGDRVTFSWNFGDNTPISREPNPTHRFTKAGTYNVVLTVTDPKGAIGRSTVTITVGSNKPPVPRIVRPVASGGVYEFNPNEMVPFACVVEDESRSTLKYSWEIQLIHNNHIHTDQYKNTAANFSASVSSIGAASHGGLRVNYLAILTVTDQRGVSAKTQITLRQKGWQQLFDGNAAPTVTFNYHGIYDPRQIIMFDATGSRDADLDYLWYYWDFGDGRSLKEGAITSHTWSTAGNKIVTLTVVDNWGATSVLTKRINIT